jgi:uncharacterized protein YndB with AHSA1/START domain
MPDIFHDFPITASQTAVFDAISTPSGLSHWWTLSSSGTPAIGNEYRLFFGPEFDWRAKVARFVPGEEFELEIGSSHADWRGTRVGFRLTPGGNGVTNVSFHHTGWPERNAHYRTSAFCWAMYLRLLRVFLETGKTVPYEQRLLA